VISHKCLRTLFNSSEKLDEWSELTLIIILPDLHGSLRLLGISGKMRFVMFDFQTGHFTFWLACG
jgi:hypothetical protein